MPRESLRSPGKIRHSTPTTENAPESRWTSPRPAGNVRAYDRAPGSTRSPFVSNLSFEPLDPTLLAALLSAATTLSGGVAVGAVRRRFALGELRARTERFVAGLPSFGKSVAQNELVRALSALERSREAYDALSEASVHLGLPEVDVASGGEERALVALVEHFVQDARTAVALACGVADTRRLLEEEPEIFGTLEADGVKLLESRPRLARAAARALEGAEKARERLEIMERRARDARERNALGDEATALAHASVGGLLGAKVGAILGTLVMPGVGTLVGTALGGLAAGMGSAEVSRERARAERERERESLAEIAWTCGPGARDSAARALRVVTGASRASREALERARASARAAPKPLAEIDPLVNDLLRTLSWRLDEGAALLESDGDFLGTRKIGWLTERDRTRALLAANETLASKRRGHARATEALKSALRAEAPVAKLGWVVAVAQPSHPELDDFYDRLARMVTAAAEASRAELDQRRRALAESWVAAVVALSGALESELARHVRMLEEASQLRSS